MSTAVLLFERKGKLSSLRKADVRLRFKQRPMRFANRRIDAPSGLYVAVNRSADVLAILIEISAWMLQWDDDSIALALAWRRLDAKF